MVKSKVEIIKLLKVNVRGLWPPLLYARSLTTKEWIQVFGKEALKDVKFQLQWFPNNHIISYIRNTMEDLSLFNDIEGLMLTMSEIDFIKSKISLYVLYALFDFDTVCVTQCLLL